MANTSYGRVELTNQGDLWVGKVESKLNGLSARSLNGTVFYRLQTKEQKAATAVENIITAVAAAAPAAASTSVESSSSGGMKPASATNVPNVRPGGQGAPQSCSQSQSEDGGMTVQCGSGG